MKEIIFLEQHTLCLPLDRCFEKKYFFNLNFLQIIEKITEMYYSVKTGLKYNSNNIVCKIFIFYSVINFKK